MDKCTHVGVGHFHELEVAQYVLRLGERLLRLRPARRDRTEHALLWPLAARVAAV